MAKKSDEKTIEDVHVVLIEIRDLLRWMVSFSLWRATQAGDGSEPPPPPKGN